MREQLQIALETKDPCLSPRGQLLKWVGNKQRYAGQIAAFFPSAFGAYCRALPGKRSGSRDSGPALGVGSDVFGPLVPDMAGAQALSSSCRGVVCGEVEPGGGAW